MLCPGKPLALPLQQSGPPAVRMPGTGGSILAVAASGQPLVMQSTVRSLSPTAVQVSSLRSVQALGNVQDVVYKDVRRIVSPTSAGASSQVGAGSVTFDVIDTNHDGVISREEFVKAFQASVPALHARETQDTSARTPRHCEDDEGISTPTTPTVPPVDAPVSGRMVRREGALGDEQLTLQMGIEKDSLGNLKSHDFVSRMSQRVEDLRLRELGKSMTRSVSVERSGGDASQSPMKACHGRTPKSEDALFSPTKNGHGSQSPTKRTGRERTSSVWRLPWSQPKSPVAPRLVVPYALPRESLAEKYAVNWNERVHTGLLNGLRLPQQVCISSVFRAKAKNNSRLIAVKVVHRKHIAYPKLFQQQLSDMHNMDHPNICRLLDVYEDPHHVYLVFDYLSGPSLIEKVLDDPQFSERDAAAAFKVVLQTIAYLHERNIVYQNLHPENLRYAAPPKKKGSGSAYGDQLKLLDFGLCLQSKHLSQDVQISGTPDAHPLPLLQLVGAGAAQVSPCAPPEYAGFRGNVGTYAQLAAALGSTEAANPLPRGNAGLGGRDCPNPPLAKMRRDAQSPVRSAQAASALEDPFSRHVRELHRLLEAGDMWAAGCILHMLLTGTMPSESAEPCMVSALPLDVQDLLSGLLRRDPRVRLTATEALQSDWFRRWDALPKAHRSQAKAGSPAALSLAPSVQLEDLRLNLTGHHAAHRFRKLVFTLTALNSCMQLCGSEDLFHVKGPPEATAQVSLEDLTAALSYESYLAMTRGRSAESGLSIGDLMDALEKATDLPCRDLDWALQATIKISDEASTISPEVFADFVREACGLNS